MRYFHNLALEPCNRPGLLAAVPVILGRVDVDRGCADSVEPALTCLRSIAAHPDTHVRPWIPPPTNPINH